jgi:hypothetical protein
MFKYPIVEPEDRKTTANGVSIKGTHLNGGLNQILKRQTSPFHYGSKSPAVTTTAFTTILEQNR